MSFPYVFRVVDNAGLKVDYRKISEQLGQCAMSIPSRSSVAEIVKMSPQGHEYEYSLVAALKSMSSISTVS